MKNSGTSFPGDYYFEFSCGRGGSSSENVHTRGSGTESASQSASENESEYHAAHGTEDDLRPLPHGFSAAVTDNVVGDAVEETQNFLVPKRDDEVVDNGIVSAKSTVSAEVEVEEIDLKVTVDSILDHSSGAALYEQIVSFDTTVSEESADLNESAEGENLKKSRVLR